MKMPLMHIYGRQNPNLPPQLHHHRRAPLPVGVAVMELSTGKVCCFTSSIYVTEPLPAHSTEGQNLTLCIPRAGIGLGFISPLLSAALTGVNGLACQLSEVQL